MDPSGLLTKRVPESLLSILHNLLLIRLEIAIKKHQARLLRPYVFFCK